MRIIASLLLAGMVLSACDEVILRQPSLGQPDVRVPTEEIAYEVTAIDLTPEVVSRANSSPFEQLVVLDGDRTSPARLVQPSEAIRRNPPPANREFDYVLGTGDVLRLSRVSYAIGPDGVEREEVVTRTLDVAEGGYVELADGRQVQVSGLTVEQARQAIASALVDSSERLASEVLERPLPRISAPEYRVGSGDILALSRLDRVRENGEFSNQLVTRPVKVETNGTINVLDIGTIEVAGLTTAELKDTISQEALRAGLSAEILVEVQEFNAKSVLVTGDLDTRLVPITTEPLTIDRLLARVNPSLSRERDFLVKVERGSETYQMRARTILLEAERDQYAILDGDRVIIERLAQLPSFQLSVADFRSQIVTFTGVGETGVNEIVLTNQGLDLRRLLTRMGQDADRNQDALIRLFRNNREYRLSAQDVLLNSPGTRYWLQPDDHVIVEDLVYTRNTALIIGTVGRPQRLELQPVQRSTLSEALFGGRSQPAPDADFGHIYVLRGSGRAYTAYHLDLRDVLRAGLAERFELRPGDIVFVRKRPISKFNEVLRLGLGLTSGAQAIGSITDDVTN